MKDEENQLSEDELDAVNGGAIPNIPGPGVSFNQSKFNRKLRNAQVDCSGVIGLPDDEELEEDYEKARELVKYTTDLMLKAGNETLKASTGMTRIK